MYNKANRFCPNNKHTLQLFDDYWDLYRCERCDSYWTAIKETKNKVTFSFTIVEFSPNDDRIINVWCQDRINQYMKEQKKEKLLTIEEYYFGKKRKYLTKKEKIELDNWKNEKRI